MRKYISNKDIICLQFKEGTEQFPVNSGHHLPVITCQIINVQGDRLDWDNLSDEDLQKLILNEKTNVIHFPEFNHEVIELATHEIYSNTHKYLPNIVYAPESFDIGLLAGVNYSLHRSKLLHDNNLVMLAQDDMAFPAYKKGNGDIEFINPGMFIFIDVQPTVTQMAEADHNMDKALEALANAALDYADAKNNVRVETVNVDDLENGIWRETADDQEDWDEK